MKLTVRDAAKLLNTTEAAVYGWIHEGTIPVHRVHQHYRFHRSELLEWATSRGIRVAPEELHEDENGSPLPRLADALEAGGVHYDVPGADRKAVLRAVVDRIPIDDADRDMLYDFLLAREALGSTGVGDGIAIPHVRNPVVLHTQRPSLTLCFLATPVDFDAIDGKPVDIIFSLVTPTIRSHLFLLSRISAALHDHGFRAAVVARASCETILSEARRVEATLPPPKGEHAK